MKVAIVGAGWAGCAAAVEATRLGHDVTLFEASRSAGGRARRVDMMQADSAVKLDNGQHILIGAYAETLQLMASLGVDLEASFLRLPLTLKSANGDGLTFPDLPAPLDALVGMLRATGWTWQDKLSLLKVSIRWRINQFRCAPQSSVTDVCNGVSPRIMATLMEPLCVSALNTPIERASGQVFLRVMRDALFSGNGASNLLLPKLDLSALMPDAALAWLEKNGAKIRLGVRAKAIALQKGSWSIADAGSHTWGTFEGIVLACPPGDAVRLAHEVTLSDDAWLSRAVALQHEAIATVYAMSKGVRLSQPMLTLSAGIQHPAQFVFDRGQLGGPAGLLAFVVSASTADRTTVTEQVRAQAAEQLNLHDLDMQHTIVEKRATFACSPGLERPGPHLAPGLLACGDYVAGPYPATLEGAVISGLHAARLIGSSA